jgi:NTE family protein
MAPERRTDLGLVLSGGGARAAYQVGLLRAIARRFPDLDPPILTGVSAGAINCAWIAAHAQRFADKLAGLDALWRGLTADQVFQIGTLQLARNVARTGLRLVSGGLIRPPRTGAMVDTAPLHALLERVIGGPGGRFANLEQNIASGAVCAVAITASSYSTGQSITWVQGPCSQPWQRAQRRSVPAELTVEHVMASAALPLFFPAVQVGGQWYGDGGIRLTAPLSPAIHLGARKVLAISTRYARTQAEANQPSIEDYPPPAQVGGVLLNAIFLDQFDGDALAMQRVNRLIEALPPERREGLRPVELLVLRPSRDLGKLANAYEARLPGAFRFLTRGLGTRETRSNDLLSLVMFQPDYLACLLELGEADGEARMGEIADFLRR